MARNETYESVHRRNLLGRLNTYLFKRAVSAIGGLIVFACCVLLLERLLRIFEVVTTSTKPASDASNMIVSLLPYYLGIAVPMALMLGTIITIDRFSRSSELTAALGAGVSLTHMTKPFLAVAAILAVGSILIEGWLQPLGRYRYRTVENSVKQTSFTAALREGTFTTVGTRTYFGGTAKPNAGIGPIFIYDAILDDDGVETGFRLTTANEGELIIREESGAPVLQLGSGLGYQVTDNSRLSDNIGFAGMSIAGASNPTPFRIRGNDERELTSTELFENRRGDQRTEIDRNTNNATLHRRIARTMLLFLIPFIAVPFGLNYGRNPSSAGIFVGVVFVVSFEKALEFAQSLGASGKLPPWVGIWGLMTFLTIFAAFVFWKSAFKMGQPPLTSFAQWVSHAQGQVRTFVQKTRRRLRGDTEANRA
jgi:lipopolysaccharide export system permease protein